MVLVVVNEKRDGKKIEEGTGDIKLEVWIGQSGIKENTQEDGENYVGGKMVE